MTTAQAMTAAEMATMTMTAAAIKNQAMALKLRPDLVDPPLGGEN
jgi:hypothetical protein